MLVILGIGPQESAASGYPRTYDHPYFGQIFLGGILGLIGYPNILNPGTLVQSIELLHLVPRLLMGLVAILDTFLLFKITEKRYSLVVALMASILFAVMPFTWIFRRVYLDTILVPLLLSSILFAVYLKNHKNQGGKIDNQTINKVSSNTLVVLSGIFLGLAIYTKAPTVTMIPLVGSFVFLNSEKKLKTLGLWFIPVILIPLLWPLYSVVAGQTDLWVQWVLWQTGRNKPLSISLTNFVEMDPVIVIVGIIGFIWTAVRKDFFPLVWVIPFLVFSYFIGWVQYFHLVPIFPAFCIASAVLLNDIRKFLARYVNKLLSVIPFLVPSIFGLVVTGMLITTNVNSSYFAIYSSIAQNLPAPGSNLDHKVTVAGSHWWVWDSYWITEYVLRQHHNVIDPHFDPNFKQPVGTNSVLFIDDQKFLDSLSRKEKSDNLAHLIDLHNKSHVVSTFMDNVTSNDNNKYPNNIFSIMILNENHPTGKIIIRRNY